MRLSLSCHQPFLSFFRALPACASVSYLSLNLSFLCKRAPASWRIYSMYELCRPKHPLAEPAVHHHIHGHTDQAVRLWTKNQFTHAFSAKNSDRLLSYEVSIQLIVYHARSSNKAFSPPNIFPRDTPDSHFNSPFCRFDS